MNKILIGFAVVALVLFGGWAILSGGKSDYQNIATDTDSSAKNSGSGNQLDKDAEKIYVALEGESKAVVIKDGKLYKEIDLSKTEGSKQIIFSAHNIQVAPDGKTVWVTAMAKETKDLSFRLIPIARADEMDSMNMGDPDEVIVINPRTDEIIKRIPLAVGAHLAHVALTPDSAYAYVTAQKEGAIYKINAKTYAVEREFKASDGSEPHGLRITPDGSSVYIAYLKGKAMGVLDAKSGVLSEVKFNGAAVQAGVTPDGKIAMASLYNTKKIAILNVGSNVPAYIDLPSDSKGPVQIYPTPDSKYVYVADQGYYFDQPVGNKIYKIDLASRKVVSTIDGGQAPHGVVVSKDGRYVYVTNLLGNDVSVIDAVTDKEIARIPAGKTPNGISIWSESQGGTP